MHMILHVGLDVGSTTAKMVAVDRAGNIVYHSYRRHLSDVKNTVLGLLSELRKRFPAAMATMNVSGSAGLSLAKHLDLPFIQEVIACTQAVERFIPETEVVIELGGEDAKIIYFRGGMEQRMNSACAGGTGAFIDQIASLLQTDAEGLNRLAASYETLYPIASRCGVFAKTDVQPLLNEGARKEDIAASIFQSVVNQTISGLACGRPIRGKVAFLGGPLTFLSGLRDRFIETLGLKSDEAIFPEHAQYFVAIGAAFNSAQAYVSDKEVALQLDDLWRNVNRVDFKASGGKENVPLAPLFANEEELAEFRSRHARATAERGRLADYQGPCYLGIDAGSTTTKIVLIGALDELLYTSYGSNQGNPLQSVLHGMKELYRELPPGAWIARSVVTGYGEGLIKAALRIDAGEIETVAHYKAAVKFRPDVDFILDIGGQDMKCMKIKNGTIDSLMLNEACSAGCGSFLESFASALGLPIQAFAEEALSAQHPVDLGSRCTVFMNSKVKQVQKEGATLSDLSAGLSYSVVKNALQKVIKLRNPEDLGERVVVQGGTFLNEAVLRAFELLTGSEAVRPDTAGIMGAYGAALIAKEQAEQIAADLSVISGERALTVGAERGGASGAGQEQGASSLLASDRLDSFTCEVSRRRCGLCGNHCLLTVNKFPDRSVHITGNRCERGAGQRRTDAELPNLFAYKYERIFAYEALPLQEAPRGRVGIPRVLNMYENYPFWHTFFTRLGYHVMLSPRSDKGIFEKGMESIPSESVCYPAKLAHGHITALAEAGADFIFYPSVIYERKEEAEADNHFNCPVVTSYPEVIRTNMDVLGQRKIDFRNPFLTLDSKPALKRELCRAFPDIARKEIGEAVDLGWQENEQVRADIRRKGEEAVAYLTRTGKKGIVLSGRPYHIDPEIHHGIPELITGFGMAVLTEDSIAHLGVIEGRLRVVNQWKYHSRLYRAASFVSQRDDLELVQLTSFGCGLDAITADMVQEILENRNKMYTLLKIDEINNLGAARIRIRSLQAAMNERARKGVGSRLVRQSPGNAVFTPEMGKTYTIIAPQMSPIHFDLIQAAAMSEGYKLVVLEKAGRPIVDEGLRHVNNDACYPAILTIGQIMHALKSGDYDINRTAVMMTQTGGGCRATNYIALLRKALQDAGMSHVPVIAVSASGIEKQPGFKLSLGLIRKVIAASCYGDLLARVLYRSRPYERKPGSAQRLFDYWNDVCKLSLDSFRFREYSRIVRDIVRAFDALPVSTARKPRVGVVGEILVKFHPDANNHLIELIEAEGGEAVLPDLLDFFLYCSYNPTYKSEHMGKSAVAGKVASAVIAYLEHLRKPMKEALKASGRYGVPHRIEEMAAKAGRLLSVGNQTGEGWFLTGEMMELLDEGVSNIVCAQPFACLPNHVVGRGMIKGLKELYPEANISAIDYDAGASEINQVNRLKLMMSVAFKKSDGDDAGAGSGGSAAKSAEFFPRLPALQDLKEAHEIPPLIGARPLN